MQLSTPELIDYLVERRLVDGRDLVDGKVVVADVTRRNRNRRVEVEGARGLFIKQAGEDDQRKRDSLVREAVTYEFAVAGGELEGLESVTPRYLGFDQQAGLLVLELLDAHASLGDELRASYGVRPEVAAACGDALAVAARSGMGVALGGGAPALPRALPWPLVFHGAQPMPGVEGSAGQSQLLAVVRADAAHVGVLSEIARGWRVEALVHGDLKWDNCVVVDGGKRLVLLDWELADLGDAAWDLGCLLQGALSQLIVTSPQQNLAAFASGQPGPQVAAHLAPSNRALLEGYARTAGLSREAFADLRLRALRYAAARMVQTAYEFSMGAAEPPPQAWATLACGRALALEPPAAARLLLGEGN
ncbi:phosphotransferase [Engelhardtia mirabilis]|uniref:Phosphotransferase enzyme family protein n=1 Tax=Engelhardtia mirabilis TaxID=2528011 RepID=A0A518BHT1_9BACT|nr:Phosphotransferase enzyme family protein [Planctomycetes bacterium Pla133]QDV00852.1 Phosphotransferase enzyme family protein [Planctomycetes bacterium Pla86]